MTRYISLDEFLLIAESVLEIDAIVLEKASRLSMAESALHAPAAGFGNEDFYPDLTDKAAVLCCRLTWNHPLQDGNKRSAWLTTRAFIALNGGDWLTPPNADEVETMMVAVACSQFTEDDLADWFRSRIRWSPPSPTRQV